MPFFFLVTSFGQLSLGVFWAGKTWGIQRRKTWWKLAANKLQNSIHVIDQPICFEPSNFPNIILVLLYPMILSVFVFHMYIAINHKLLLNPPFSMAGQTYPISSPAYHWYNAYMPKQWPEIAQTWPGKSKYLFKHQKNYYTCISLYIHIFNVYIYILYSILIYPPCITKGKPCQPPSLQQGYLRHHWWRHRHEADVHHLLSKVRLRGMSAPNWALICRYGQQRAGGKGKIFLVGNYY